MSIYGYGSLYSTLKKKKKKRPKLPFKGLIKKLGKFGGSEPCRGGDSRKETFRISFFFPSFFLFPSRGS